MKPPSGETILNGLAIFALGGLGGALIVHAVPGENAQLVGVIVGGIIGFLTGAATTKPPAGPTP